MQYLNPPPMYLFEQPTTYHWGTMNMGTRDNWLYEWADECLENDENEFPDPPYLFRDAIRLASCLSAI